MHHVLCFLRHGWKDASSLTFTTDHKVYTNAEFKKGELVLFPVGSVQKMKEVADAKDKKQKPLNVVKVLSTKNFYQVLQPKADL